MKTQKHMIPKKPRELFCNPGKKSTSVTFVFGICLIAHNPPAFLLHLLNNLHKTPTLAFSTTMTYSVDWQMKDFQNY